MSYLLLVATELHLRWLSWAKNLL